jgi:hypothetical protein
MGFANNINSVVFSLCRDTVLQYGYPIRHRNLFAYSILNFTTHESFPHGHIYGTPQNSACTID